MKTNIAIGLAAICAILLAILLVKQSSQKAQLDALRQQQDSYAQATEQRQKDLISASEKMSGILAMAVQKQEGALARANEEQQQTLTNLATSIAANLASATVQQSKALHDATDSLNSQFAAWATNVYERLTRNEQEIKENGAMVANIVQQNTAVMHRALGKVIPVELPESVTNKLAVLEARIADETSWPTNSDEANALIVELKDLMREIPPWAEEDLLPRLNAVRWAVQSFQVLQANAAATNEDFEAAAEAYANQLSIQPDGGSTNLAAKLAIYQTNANTSFETFRLESAISEATNQLGSAVMADGLAIWQRLSEWTNNPQVAERRRQLHSRLLADGITDFIETAQGNLQRFSGITNAALRQAGYARLFDSVTEQRLNVLQQPDVTQDPRDQLDIFSKTVEIKLKEEANKQNLGYQQWSLGKVRDFRETFDTAMNRTTPGMLYGRNLDPDLQGVDDAMVRYLAPISPGYLDASVANLYNQAFNDGWNKLGSIFQDNVAEQDVKIVKRTPQNYQEDQ